MKLNYFSMTYYTVKELPSSESGGKWEDKNGSL